MCRFYIHNGIFSNKQERGEEGQKPTTTLTFTVSAIAIALIIKCSFCRDKKITGASFGYNNAITSPRIKA